MATRSEKLRIKNQAEKVIWVTFFWTLFSISQFLLGYATLTNFNVDIANINPSSYFLGGIITGVVAGVSGGSLIVFFWERWLRNKSYSWSLISIFFSYTILFFIVSILVDLFSPETQINTSFILSDSWNEIWSLITTLAFIQNYLSWLFIVIITLIALLVNDKYGPGQFVSFLLGKYFHPKREERIFMFLDLRGATSIAEQLGEDKYFNFLKDLFKNITPDILNSKGEIYQYVGDEVVISWTKDKGISKANCLKCYFDITQRLLDQRSYYVENYNGIIPEFRAGLHFGFVMVGEMGVVKREIAYSGDVLNTAARIQSKCSELGHHLLISKHLMMALGSSHNSFKPIPVGEIGLKGKQFPLMLYTL